MHQVEALVDLVQRQLMGNQIVDIDLPLHVPVDDLRHVGAPSGAAEGGALPHPAGDQLERPRRDFLAGARHPDDDADPPSAVAAFERLAHDPDIADALEAVIGAALCQIDEIGDEVARDLLRVDKMRHAEFLGQCPSAGVEVDPDDHVGAGHPAPLNDIEPDPAETEDDNLGAGLDLGGVDYRADAGRDAAADIADLVEGRVLADLRDGDLGQHREVRKGRGAHVMVDLVAAEREPAGAVGHHALALGRADRDAEIGLARQAIFALPAFGSVERDHVVALGDAGDPAPDIDDDPGAFMAEDRREQPFGIGPGRVNSSVWQIPVALISTRTSPVFGPVELNFFDFQRLSGLESHSSACLHDRLPGRIKTSGRVVSPFGPSATRRKVSAP